VDIAEVALQRVLSPNRRRTRDVVQNVHRLGGGEIGMGFSCLEQRLLGIQDSRAQSSCMISDLANS
jgi:hypothetical protein